MVTTGSGGAATDAPPLVEARGLRVQFGKVTALDGLDLVARAGQVLAVLGPDGAGKTTFIRTVAALVPPSGGELRVRGFDVSRDPAAVRREIGLAGQAAAVEPTMTGRENPPIQTGTAIAFVLAFMSAPTCRPRRWSTRSALPSPGALTTRPPPSSGRPP